MASQAAPTPSRTNAVPAAPRTRSVLTQELKLTILFGTLLESALKVLRDRVCDLVALTSVIHILFLAHQISVALFPAKVWNQTCLGTFSSRKIAKGCKKT